MHEVLHKVLQRPRTHQGMCRQTTVFCDLERSTTSGDQEDLTVRLGQANSLVAGNQPSRISPVSSAITATSLLVLLLLDWE